MKSPELVRIILINREALLLVWRIQNMNIIIDKLRGDQAPSGELGKKPMRWQPWMMGPFRSYISGDAAHPSTLWQRDPGHENARGEIHKNVKDRSVAISPTFCFGIQRTTDTRGTSNAALDTWFTIAQCLKDAALYYLAGLRILVERGGCDCAAYART